MEEILFLVAFALLILALVTFGIPCLFFGSNNNIKNKEIDDFIIYNGSIQEKYIWLPVISIFLISRLINNDFSVLGILAGALFCILPTYWFVIPFLNKKDMRVPGYSFNMKYGKDKYSRALFFVFGVFLIAGSLLEIK